MKQSSILIAFVFLACHLIGTEGFVAKSRSTSSAVVPSSRLNAGTKFRSIDNIYNIVTMFTHSLIGIDEKCFTKRNELSKLW